MITAILVTYNSAGIIADALVSIAADPVISRTIVVDNASVDNTCALVRERFPTVELIQNPENTGFGRGNNVALERVTTDFALLINPDAVLEAGTVTALLDAAQRYPEAAMLAPLLLNEKGDILHTYKRNLFTREAHKTLAAIPEGDLCAEFLSGAVWLLRMPDLRKVGFFDPRLFLYFEDDDLCLRLRAAGHSLVLATQARAMHRMGRSVAPSPEVERRKHYHFLQSRLYMENKYRGVAAVRRMLRRETWFWRMKILGASCILHLSAVERYRVRLAAIRDFRRANANFAI